ncbi:hypothetical protein DFP72DRAFT_1106074 [Ephemerocybe angulata]|uniref:Uncharacterized protein n=1 Tax=Ephemerocybe angulata TaxID=980116 RepID=A0A8H6HA02_9AGAR|nr:hypothetical protein DFP72DRAFT_1106074 [Tulosesus angulatus]
MRPSASLNLWANKRSNRPGPIRFGEPGPGRESYDHSDQSGSVPRGAGRTNHDPYELKDTPKGHTRRTHQEDLTREHEGRQEFKDRTFTDRHDTMFHEDFDRSTHNRYAAGPSRHRHPTAVHPPPVASPTGRLSTTSPDSPYFADVIIRKYNERKEREKSRSAHPTGDRPSLAELAGYHPNSEPRTGTPSWLVPCDIGVDEEPKRKKEDRRWEGREKKERKERKTKEKGGRDEDKGNERERRKNKRKHRENIREKELSKGASNESSQPPTPPTKFAHGSGPLHPALNPSSPHAMFSPSPSTHFLLRGSGVAIVKLGQFAKEVTRISQEVGTEGELGGQAHVLDVEGTWREPIGVVNKLAANLTN